MDEEQSGSVTGSLQADEDVAAVYEQGRLLGRPGAVFPGRSVVGNSHVPMVGVGRCRCLGQMFPPSARVP